MLYLGRHLVACEAGALRPDPISEQRKDIRYEVLDYALVYCPKGADPVRSVIVDIGLGGLQIRSRDQLPIGCNCVIAIGNGAREAVEIHGEIRHCAKVDGSDLYSTGIKFLPRDGSERTTVAEYVHSVFQRQADHLL